MGKKVTIELTEKQAMIVLDAVEEWFRLRMGQSSGLANGLAFLGYKPDMEYPEKFDLLIQRRNDIDSIIKAIFNIAFPYNSVQREVDPDVRIASDIWSELRYQIYPKNEWTSTPFQIGTEPMPKITVVDE